METAQVGDVLTWQGQLGCWCGRRQSWQGSRSRLCRLSYHVRLRPLS